MRRHVATALPIKARQIPGFPGFWLTNRGEVFSFWRYCDRSKEHDLVDAPKKLDAGFNHGKRRVCMHKDGVQVQRSVDALVRLVFG